MALIPWSPFSDLEKFFEEEDFVPFLPVRKVLGGFGGTDIYEKDNKIIVEMQLPGIDPEKVDINFEGEDRIIVEGKVEEKKEEKGKQYWRREIKRGAFSRMLQLPSAVDPAKTKAEYKNGLLIITAPKKEKKKLKMVKVKIKK